MYELIILSLLIQGPAHGYLIAKIINDIFGPYAKISNGRLYPLLARLEEEGLIEWCPQSVVESATPKGTRQHRNYQITAAGRRRFHRLMMDTSSNPGEYQRIFLRKADSLHLLSLDEQLYLIDHYINYCQSHVLHLIAEAEDVECEKYGMSAVQLKATLNVMRHMQDQWRLEVEWAQQLREHAIASSPHQKPGDQAPLLGNSSISVQHQHQRDRSN